MIGCIGLRRCYVNIEKDKAIERYCKTEKINIEDFNEDVFEIKFDDEFGAYDLYEYEL